MIVRRLALTDFRNYATADVELAPGANLVVGPNGQGKTNLVESLGYLATLGSHRVSSDQALIRSGADRAVIRAALAHGDRSIRIEVELNRAAANRAQVNGSGVRIRELPRYVATVLFAPEDLVLVRGEPSGRRRFLDELLVQRTPRLAGVLADYDRVLRQRNTLLKSARATRARADQLGTLDIWDERLVALGSEIVVARAVLVDELRPQVDAAYVAVAGAEHATQLRSVTSVFGAKPDDDDAPDAEPAPTASPTDADAVADGFRDSLARTRALELERGLTLTGPHRDDLALSLNDLPARGYASHGETWSFALALKLASARLLRETSPAGDPVLMLDDVFAELDEGRRGRLAEAVAEYEQVLVTAAVEADVPAALAGRTIRIRAGAVVDD